MNQIVSPSALITTGTSRLFEDGPKPDRAEWEKTLAKLKPFLSPEKFAETEAAHWRIFDRANRWFDSRS